MRRAQKGSLPPARILPKAVLDRAKEKLSDDWLGFVAGTSAEDPKPYILRLEAAEAAYSALERIGGAGETPADADDDVLRGLRLHMAAEAGKDGAP
jgi:hypothetical protein